MAAERSILRRIGFHATWALLCLVGIYGGAELLVRQFTEVPEKWAFQTLQPDEPLPTLRESGEPSRNPENMLYRARDEKAPDGRTVFATTLANNPSDPAMQFLLPKLDSEIHLGCVGGSVPAGPSTGEAYCRRTAELLGERNPGVTVRWINEAQVGASSVDVIHSAVALLENADLDVLVAHIFHNEFLGLRDVLLEPVIEPWAEFLLEHLKWSRFFHFVQHWRTEEAIEHIEIVSDDVEQDVWTIRFVHRGPTRKSVRYDEVRRAVLDRYELNLRRLVAEAKAKGVALVLVEGSRNPQDASFDSAPPHEASFETVHRLLADEERLTALLLQEDWARVESVARGMLELDPGYAAGWYGVGTAAWKTGRKAEAAEALQKANDATAFPFQGTADIRAVLGQVAEDTGTPLARLTPWMTLDPEFGLPEPDLFTDDVHPNDKGYRRIAEELAPFIEDLGLPRMPPKKPDAP